MAEQVNCICGGGEKVAHDGLISCGVPGFIRTQRRKAGGGETAQDWLSSRSFVSEPSYV